MGKRANCIHHPSPQFRTADLMPSPVQETYTIPREGYLYDDSTVIQDAVETGGNTVIAAPPGSGKSYAAIRGLREMGKQFIFVADTKSLADDLSTSYNLPVFHGDNPTQLSPGDSYITIYNWVEELPNEDQLDKEEIILVVDEWHSILSQYGFRGDSLTPMTLAFDGFKQVIGLTGTHLVDFKGYHTVEVGQDRPMVDVTHVSYEGLWGAIVSAIRKDPDKKHYVSLFDKKKAQDLVDVLKQEGVEEESIALFNRDTRDKHLVQKLLRTNEYPEGIRVIIATYTQGFSLKEDDAVIHVVPLPKRMHWAEQIAQVIQRFRKPNQRDVYLYWNFAETKRPPFTDLHDHHDELQDEAERRIAEYRETLELKEGEIPNWIIQRGIRATEEEVYEEVHPDNDKVNLVRPDLRTNDLQIWHNLFRAKAKNAYKTQEEMNRQLTKLGIRIAQQSYSPYDIGDEDYRPETEGGHNETDKTFKERLNECLTQLGEGKSQGNDTVARRVQHLAHYFEEEEVRTLMMEWGSSPKKWKRLKRRIRIQDRRWEKERQLAEAVYSEFLVGEKYTPTEINEKVCAILEEASGENASDMSKTDTTQLLKDHFQTKETSVRDPEGNSVRAYRILSDTPFECEKLGVEEGGEERYSFKASSD